MTNLSESEQHNYEWLTSVVSGNLGYTKEFKYFANRDRKKFMRKMKE